ncbi:hypothetical protein NECAME_04009 [Necator americanus]|uniref:Uncharacterized protein n=1 Tax=Necator americanus TaxID=51031 RepID=W2SYA7_NECAM|nr:hypothetical protein NECAME_04009 [Necator americanus]ETN74523.1 hypothetical protein NECAME_04009 [Necator americanus]
MVQSYKVQINIRDKRDIYREQYNNNKRATEQVLTFYDLVTVRRNQDSS